MFHYRRPEEEYLFDDHLFDTDPANLEKQWKFLNTDTEANEDDQNPPAEEVKESKENEAQN